MRCNRLILLGMLLGLWALVNEAYANSIYYGPTTNQDHFWQVVDKFHSNNSVTREQLGMAILQANPAAFENGNVNALRNGQMLRIPTVEEAQQINPQLAAQTLHAVSVSGTINHAGPTTRPKGGTSLATEISNLAPFSHEGWSAVNHFSGNGASEVAALHQQLQATQQELQQLERQVNLQVGRLVQQNLSLQAQVNNDNQVLEWLLHQMQRNNNTTAPHTLSSSALSGKMAQLMGQSLPATQAPSRLALSVMVLVMVALLAIIWLSPSQPSAKKVRRFEPHLADKLKSASSSWASADKDKAASGSSEYDFLSGQEGWLAKLNLARVYIDMEDFETAQRLIKDVMREGGEALRNEAYQLYQRLQQAEQTAKNNTP